MDPNANLREQLDLAQRIMELEDKPAPTDDDMALLAAEGALLANFVVSLHLWLSKGGFPPRAWQHAFNQTKVFRK